MFNASPTYVSMISEIFSEIDCRKLIKSLTILMDKKCGDPRLLAVHSRSGLVFGMLNFLSNQEETENIPEDLLYSVNRLSEAILLVLSNLPDSENKVAKTQSVNKETNEINESIDTNGHLSQEGSSDDLGAKNATNADKFPPKPLINNAVPNGIEEENRVQLPFNKIYESLIISQVRFYPTHDTRAIKVLPRDFILNINL